MAESANGTGKEGNNGSHGSIMGMDEFSRRFWNPDESNFTLIFSYGGSSELMRKSDFYSGFAKDHMYTDKILRSVTESTRRESIMAEKESETLMGLKAYSSLFYKAYKSLRGYGATDDDLLFLMKK